MSEQSHEPNELGAEDPQQEALVEALRELDRAADRVFEQYPVDEVPRTFRPEEAVGAVRHCIWPREGVGEFGAELERRTTDSGEIWYSSVILTHGWNSATGRRVRGSLDRVWMKGGEGMQIQSKDESGSIEYAYPGTLRHIRDVLAAIDDRYPDKQKPQPDDVDSGEAAVGGLRRVLRLFRR